MKKLVSSVLAGLSIISSIPNINAMHFTSETESKTVESCLKGIDWKSALLGGGLTGGLVGGIGIPVAAAIGSLIGKTKNTEKSNENIEKSSDKLFELVKLENSKYVKQLDNFLSARKESDKKFDIDINDIDDQVMKKNYGNNMEVKYQEDNLDFKKVFSVFEFRNDADSIIVLPNKNCEYDIITILVEAEESSYMKYQYLVFDPKYGHKSYSYNSLNRRLVPYSKFDVVYTLSKYLAGSIDNSYHIVDCRGYKISPDVE